MDDVWPLVFTVGTVLLGLLAQLACGLFMLRAKPRRIDPALAEAQREVDAMLPGTPPIAPPRP